MRWLPNAISILRAVASIPVVLLVAPETALLALALFSTAALTDAADGALARRLRATSALGTFLDPLADKILVLGTLGGLVVRGTVDPVPVALILGREVAVTGVRAVASGRGIAIGSTVYGKAKAGLQGAAVGAQLIVLAWPALGLGAVADAVLWIAAIATIVTGAAVVRRAMAALGTSRGSAVRAHAR